MNKIIWAVALLPIIAACGVDSGTVYAKYHEPARHWTTTEQVNDYITTQTCRYSATTKTTQCTPTRQWVGSHPETRQHYDPECWKIKIRDTHGDTGSKCIDAGEYKSLDIGDWYGDHDGN